MILGRHLILLALLSVAVICRAEEKDITLVVDAWEKQCSQEFCTLTLFKDMKGAKSDKEYFTLGFKISRTTEKPDFFVFSVPPNPQSTVIILDLVDLEASSSGFKAVPKRSASFTTRPCAVRNDCKLLFDHAVLPGNLLMFPAREVDLWEALTTHTILLIRQAYSVNGENIERSALISLAAFKHSVKGLIAQSSNELK